MTGRSIPIPRKYTGAPDHQRYPGLKVALSTADGDGLIPFPTEGCGYKSRDLMELQVRDFARPVRHCGQWHWRITTAGEREIQ